MFENAMTKLIPINIMLRTKDEIERLIAMFEIGVLSSFFVFKFF